MMYNFVSSYHPQQDVQQYYFSSRSDFNHEPPGLLMRSTMPYSSMTYSYETMESCHSILSYDDTPIIAPSIEFQIEKDFCCKRC